jgi:exodeoxyribonuclease V gamma subunit
VLALALAATEGEGRAITVGRMRDRARTSTITAPADPAAVLVDLLDLYDRGMCEPLPLAVKTSSAYAGSRLDAQDADRALDTARKEWNRAGGGEQEDRSHAYVWGDRPAFEDLLVAEPGDGETWPGESTRFGALACRFWTPVRAAEQTS